ncbi:AraC family transcriptional regulator [Ktedonosporobacter rubrisoli]|uniref:AraC family transcriptional regulator n=1 Tax=Ktedonosporobacter rubrisoli TaxID=2509675 RepID=A0A4P6K4P1_KTERU|nr:helix-turn-helix domain-containing protein [Ktedonosporobacter rubrisoli]QBD83174.1 AraC family transcriptional regulator [Ktedonosporobacter rubrisoli]
MSETYADKHLDMKLPQAEKINFRLTCYQPAEDLAFLVEHYWIVSWDFRGKAAYLAEILPHPRVHLVIAQDQAKVFGVVKGKFSYRYEEAGHIFGLRFKPGAFYPFTHIPIAQLTNTSLSLSHIFGLESSGLAEIVLKQEDTEAIRQIEKLLRKKLPTRDEYVEMVQQILNTIITDRQIIRVDNLVSRFKLHKRTLQRLFRQYVGVSPKWVIEHYRLHEVARYLAEGARIDWSQLALDLGYYDQAHLIKEFKAMLGQAPTEYARQIGKHSSVSSTCVLLHKLVDDQIGNNKSANICNFTG